MKVSFVIPFHNEEKNSRLMLTKLVSFCKKQAYRSEIVPVDDRSSDNTGKILKEFSRKYAFINPLWRRDDGEEKGNTMGRALVEASKKASGEIIIWTMGDLSDDMDTYGEIISRLKKGDDLVFGSRYMPGGSRGNLDPLKAFLSSWGTLLARLLFAVPVHDITNAFRGFKRELIEKIQLDSAGFSISPEFAIKAHLAGYRLGEVPTVYTNRKEGVSSFKLYHMTKSYLEVYSELFFRFKILHQPLDFIKNK
ncbi:glycosyltransferase [Candidatus Microgenomates bacterium]|nr:glycosyltransferase [Candidatus Microgenomates bacterium]